LLEREAKGGVMDIPYRDNSMERLPVPKRWLELTSASQGVV
jgi:hypothetical protein